MNTSANNKRDAGKGNLWALFVLIFIDFLNYFLVIPVFQRLFSASYSLLPQTMPQNERDLLFGFAVLLSPLAFILFSPLVGHLSDRYGRKKILVACLFFSFFGYLLPIFGIYTNTLWLILLGRFLAGASTGSQPIAQAAVADITHGKQKAIYIAMIGFAMTIAMTIGPTAGAVLSDATLTSWFSIALPYWIGAILSAGNIILLFVYFQETYKSATTPSPKPSLLTAFKRPTIIYLCLVFLFLELAWSQYYQVLFLQMPKAYHYSTTQIAIFTSYLGCWMSVGLTFIYRFFIRRIKVLAFLRLSLILAATSLLVLSVLTAIPVQWIFVIFLAVFTGTAYANALTLLSNATDARHQGVVLGFTSTLLGFAWAVTAFTDAAFIRFSIHFPFYIASFCMIIAVFLAYTLLKGLNR